MRSERSYNRVFKWSLCYLTYIKSHKLILLIGTIFCLFLLKVRLTKNTFFFSIFSWGKCKSCQKQIFFLLFLLFQLRDWNCFQCQWWLKTIFDDLSPNGKVIVLMFRRVFGWDWFVQDKFLYIEFSNRKTDIIYSFKMGYNIDDETHYISKLH